MPGEKMLKNIESVKGDDKIDAQELHNALKELDKWEITRWLNHKIDKIKSVDGIHDATRDLLTKIESDPSNLELSQDQIDGLHALHALLNPNEDWSTVNIKKIDKPEVINNVHFQNVKNAIEFEGSSYGFAGWEQGMNDTPIVWSAEVLEGTSTMYFIPFTLDGKLDFSKGSSTIPGSIDIIARGFDGKALPNAEKKVAYMQDGKLVIEKSDVYAQKMKNKEFVEKLNNVTVPWLFLTQLLDTDPGKGNMKVAYLSDAAIIDAVSSGKYGLTKFQKEYDDAIAPFLSLSNGDDRNTKIAEIHKNFLPKYKDYIKENTSSVLVQLPNDVFEVDLNSTLINPISSTKLTIDGKKDQEQVDNYKSLDGGNIIVSIGKEGNTTSWNVYTKKDWASYGVDNSQKLIDPNAPVVTAEKPKDIIETTDLMKKIDALNTWFMFSGTWAITESNKPRFLVHEKQALKKLAEAWTKNHDLTKIVDNLSEAAGQTAKSEKQKKLIKDVQTLIDPKLVADGFRWVKSHNSLLDFAGLPALKQTIAAPTPKPTNPTNTVANKPADKPANKPKSSTDILDAERQQLTQLQEDAKKDILPLLQKLVPGAEDMNDYIANLIPIKENGVIKENDIPLDFTKKLQLLDATLKEDPKAISDKKSFDILYKNANSNILAIKNSLDKAATIKLRDYFNIIKYPYINDINKELKSIVKTELHPNSCTNNLTAGELYIKITNDPTNNGNYSWFPANFFKNPHYKNGVREFDIDKEKLVAWITKRTMQNIDTRRGASSPTQVV